MYDRSTLVKTRQDLQALDIPTWSQRIAPVHYASGMSTSLIAFILCLNASLVLFLFPLPSKRNPYLHNLIAASHVHGSSTLVQLSLGALLPKWILFTSLLFVASLDFHVCQIRVIMCKYFVAPPERPRIRKGRREQDYYYCLWPCTGSKTCFGTPLIDEDT